MIIDCHNHPDWLGHDLKKFLANMDEARIDLTWLLSWECPADEFEYASCYTPFGADGNGPVPFSRCVSYAERAPGKFILGYAPDPRRPEAIDRLRAANAIHGARVCGELKLRMTYDNPDALRMFRECAKLKMPVILHIDYEMERGGQYPRPNWWYGGGVEALDRALGACPETIFCGHAPGFWANISGDGKHLKESYPGGKIAPGGKMPEMLKKHPNLYCDISAGSGLNALSRDPSFATDFLSEFQDRILYGRDCFSNAHRDFLNGLGLGTEILEKIYSGNALKLVPANDCGRL